MKTTKELLGARIKEVRKSRKISQEQLSEKVDVDPRYISRIEVGRSYPSLETLENIARALEVEVKELFDFSHQEARPDSIEQINTFLKEMTDDDLKKICRIVRVFVR